MSTGPARDRISELDWVKGFAILCVLCIHAKVLAGTLIYDQLIDRAVPIFLVLFGISSELWWSQARRQHPERVALRWYKTRLARLMVPVWSVSTLWWLVAIPTGHAAELRLDLGHLVATYLGYSPWIGISWFVTIILQLVLLFPVIRWLVDRLGAVMSLIISALTTGLCALYLWDIVDAGKWLLRGPVPEPGWYYQWIFSPRALWHVTAGIVVARVGARLRGRVVAVAAMLWLVSVGLEELVQPPMDPLWSPLKRQVVARLADVPVALFVLGAVRVLRPQSPVGRVLAWFGAASWGIYLGHMLVHELVHGLGHWPELKPMPVRVAYALVLLTGGAALALIGGAVRARLQRLLTGSSAVVTGPSSEVGTER